MWEVVKFLKPICQVVQAYIFKIIIEIFQFTAGKYDTFEKEKFLYVEISTHLQTFAGSRNIFCCRNAEMRMLNKEFLHLLHLCKGLSNFISFICWD